MAAVGAEGEAEEIGLLGIAGEAVVGEIAEFVGLQIEDGEGLFFAGGVGAIAAVKKEGEATIGGDDRGGGEIVDATRVAGDFGEEFAVGELKGLGGSRRLAMKQRRSEP